MAVGLKPPESPLTMPPMGNPPRHVRCTLRSLVGVGDIFQRQRTLRCAFAIASGSGSTQFGENPLGQFPEAGFAEGGGGAGEATMALCVVIPVRLRGQQ